MAEMPIGGHPAGIHSDNRRGRYPTRPGHHRHTVGHFQGPETGLTQIAIITETPWFPAPVWNSLKC